MSNSKSVVYRDSMLPNIWCGFPCVGKTTLAKQNDVFADLESSDHKVYPSGPLMAWPDNYVKAVQEAQGHVFISTHPEVRNALRDKGIRYGLVYPDRASLGEYLARAVKRGSTHEFVALLARRWHDFIDDMEADTGAVIKIRLRPGETLSDYFGVQEATDD